MAGNVFVQAIAAVLALALYFLPAVLADRRKRHDVLTLALFNACAILGAATEPAEKHRGRGGGDAQTREHASVFVRVAGARATSHDAGSL
jgi:hypothetical protein